MADNKIGNWYFILAIIYSLFSLMVGIGLLLTYNLLSQNMMLLTSFILLPFSFAWFIFNVVVLIIILTKKYQKKHLWLPALYIFDIFFSFIIGFIIGIIGFMLQIPEATIYYIATPFGLIFPLITLILAIKFYQK